MNNPNFTQQQINEIFFIIEGWYYEWRDKFVDWNKREHSLLKANDGLLLTIFLMKITSAQEDWVIQRVLDWWLRWMDVIVDYEGCTHRLQQAIEQLKAMLCPTHKQMDYIAH